MDFAIDFVLAALVRHFGVRSGGSWCARKDFGCKFLRGFIPMGLAREMV
jgi:hypothetical protein